MTTDEKIRAILIELYVIDAEDDCVPRRLERMEYNLRRQGWSVPTYSFYSKCFVEPGTCVDGRDYPIPGISQIETEDDAAEFIFNYLCEDHDPIYK